MSVTVGVNGFGVIGKRVADAVALQPDMQLAGVADVATDFRVARAKERGFPLYGSTREAAVQLARSAGIPIFTVGLGSKQKPTNVRVSDLVNDGDIDANVQMRPGDVLIIPESRF